MNKPLIWLSVAALSTIVTHQALAALLGRPTHGAGQALAEEELAQEEPEASPVSLDWADPDPESTVDPETGLPTIVVERKLGIRMRLIPAGEYTRGFLPVEEQHGAAGNAHPREKPAHQVTLTQAMYLGETEVTQGQWFQATGERPAAHAVGDLFPVENVGRRQVINFLVSNGLRLPTEAEWEFACRAGEDSPLFRGASPEISLAESSWYAGNSAGRSMPVAQRLPNAWGLFDMIGNVAELCSDYGDKGHYQECLELGAENPTGPLKGKSYIVRGATFSSRLGDCRPSLRFYHSGGRSSTIGFRVARTP